MPGRDIDQAAGHRRVGSRLEHDGHDIQIGLHVFREEGNALGQAVGADDQFAAEIRPARLHEGRRAVATRHDNRLPFLRIERDLGNPRRHPRLHGCEFDAIEIGRSAFAQMVGHAQNIFLVFRHREPEIAIRADGVVIAGDGSAAEVGNGHHRIERRAEPAGVAMYVKRLSLFPLEPVMIDLARLGDDPIEGGRQFRNGRGILVRIIRLDFDDVFQIGQSKWNRRRRDAVGILREHAESLPAADEERVRVDVGSGQLDLLAEFAGWIAEEAHVDLLAGLTASRHDGGRPRKRADVQPIGAGSRVGAVPHLDHVGAVRRDDDRRQGVHAHQRVVVTRRQLEPFAVEDGDVRIEEAGAQSHSLDLGREPLAFLRLDEEVIDVFAVDGAVDSDVERDLLRLVELAVRFFLVDVRQGADVEGAQLRDAGGRADAHGVLAQAAVGGDLDGRLHLAVVDDLQLGDGEARRIEEDFFGVREPAAVEDQGHLRAALPAARRDAAETGRGGENLTTKAQRAQRRQQP